MSQLGEEPNDPLIAGLFELVKALEDSDPPILDMEAGIAAAFARVEAEKRTQEKRSSHRETESTMARNNRADKQKSDWYDDAKGNTCGTCGGSGSKVDSQGRHVDACPTCRGWGKV